MRSPSEYGSVRSSIKATLISITFLPLHNMSTVIRTIRSADIKVIFLSHTVHPSVRSRWCRRRWWWSPIIISRLHSSRRSGSSSYNNDNKPYRYTIVRIRWRIREDSGDGLHLTRYWWMQDRKRWIELAGIWTVIGYCCVNAHGYVAHISLSFHKRWSAVRIFK